MASSSPIETPAAIPPETPKSLPRNVKILGAASLLNDVASETVFPLMPQFLLVVLGGNRFYLGIIEGIADSVASLLKLWSGAWSDRAGQRKRPIVVGYLLAAIARPLIGAAAAPWHLLVARSADRIGKGIRTAPRDALIADSTAPAMRGRAFGFHRGMDHLGAAIGPILAAIFLWFWPHELRMLFLLSLVPGIAVVVLLTTCLGERSSKQEPKERMRLTLTPFDWRFKLYLVTLVLFTLGNSSDAFLLVRAGELGVPTALLPILWCVFHIVKSSGNFAAGFLVDRVGPRPLMIFGWLMYGLIYLGFGLATAAWQIWLLFLIYGIFFALVEPAEKTLVTRLVAPDRKGLAFGWFNFAIGIAAFPSSLVFGWIYDQFGSLAAFAWGGSLAIVAVILLLGVRVKETSPSS